MKITNISQSTLYLRGLKFVRDSQAQGPWRGEDMYLAPGTSIYLPNTTEVIRSAKEGELWAWAHSNPPMITLEDTETLAKEGDPGDSITLTHNWGLPPIVYVLKKVGTTWVDATGTYDMLHDANFTSVLIANTIPFVQTLYVRLM